jgi:C4-dicarboxylate-specific signal transduction histidine kinase
MSLVKDKEYTNHQHIGNIETNPEVEEAYRALYNRNRLEAVEQALKDIEAIIDRCDAITVKLEIES